MARCELARECPFFNDRLEIEHQMSTLFKARYCKGSSQECARYVVYAACGRAAVPADLAPNDRLRARTIVYESDDCGGSDLVTSPEVATR